MSPPTSGAGAAGLWAVISAVGGGALRKRSRRELSDAAGDAFAHGAGGFGGAAHGGGGGGDGLRARRRGVGGGGLRRGRGLGGGGFGLVGGVGFVDFDGGFDQRAQLGEGDGFLQVVERAFFEGFYGLVGVAEGGDDGDGGVEGEAVDVLDDFEAGAVGHAHVGEDEGVVAAFEFVFGVFHAGGGVHAQAHFHQGHFHQVADVRFVVHHQYGVLQVVTLHGFCPLAV